MGKAKDITGVVFGRLTAVERVSIVGESIWLCKCSCGNDTRVKIGQLTTGRTKSCGCLSSEAMQKASKLRSIRSKDKSVIRKKIISMSIPEPNSGCWLWTGDVDRKGYGRTSTGRTGTRIASRVSFHAFCDDPADGVVMHKCDTPSCVNPDHLRLGSTKDNNQDMFAKGRARPRGLDTYNSRSI